MPKKETTLKKLEKQTELLEEILKDTKKTKNYILWLRFLGILKVLIIIIPIILAIIYIPPQLKRAAQYFQEQFQEYQESIKRLPQLFNEDNEQPE